LNLEFNSEQPFRSVANWTTYDRKLYEGFSSTFLLILILWAVVWIRELLSSWKQLSMVNYAQTRTVQLAFGFFWRQAVLGITYFIVQYFVIIYGALSNTSSRTILSSSDTFTTVASILFREQTQLFGKQLYITIHVLVLFFVFLPADRHTLSFQAEYVVTEAEVDIRVTERKRLLEIIRSNIFLKSMRLLDSKRNLRKDNPEVFCLELALFLRAISYEAYFDPRRMKTQQFNLFSIGKSKIRPATAVPVLAERPEMVSETALKIPGTKEYLDVEQLGCKLLVGKLFVVP